MGGARTVKGFAGFLPTSEEQKKHEMFEKLTKEDMASHEYVLA
jgi:hypothetical protein